VVPLSEDGNTSAFWLVIPIEQDSIGSKDEGIHMKREKMVKAALACFMCSAVVVGLFQVGYCASEFELVVLWAKGVMVGYEDGSLRLDQPVTRAQAVKILLAAIGEGSSGPTSSNEAFLDVGRSHWAYGYVMAAAEIGLARGRPGSIFDPEQAVTMAEFAVMIGRVYTRLGGARSIAVPEIDVEPSWAAPEIAVWPELVEMLVKSGTVVNLDYPASREQVAALTAWMMDRLGLIYDLTGIVDRISQDGRRLDLRVDDSTFRVEVLLSEKVQWYMGTASADARDVVGRLVRVVLDTSGRAAVVVSQ